MESIILDLNEQEPIQVLMPTKLYQNSDKFKTKLRSVKYTLQRSSRLKNRCKILMAYFYLGELIESPDLLKSKRCEIRHEMSSYQYTVAIRTY